jgi:hypothetical protein
MVLIGIKDIQQISQFCIKCKEVSRNRVPALSALKIKATFLCYILVSKVGGSPLHTHTL